MNKPKHWVGLRHVLSRVSDEHYTPLMAILYPKSSDPQYHSREYEMSPYFGRACPVELLWVVMDG
jgi:hypothetical protein